ncbi:hypothetical protein HUG15_16945 [Salicibibacter cibarius]|uniref:Uncharacterized protein n=1 Tax=Salicibibacter cibarius TaxID=2743000 RepID=A0A7T6Z653_9BACI|nr:hypothetical protein [Salicibibacter cibarius]QQK77096.1 hypothetical protein HUG15_16945 [Salicibibacter cibarius]
MIKMALMALRKLAEVILAAFTFGIVMAVISYDPAAVQTSLEAESHFVEGFQFVFIFSFFFS